MTTPTRTQIERTYQLGESHLRDIMQGYAQLVGLKLQLELEKDSVKMHRIARRVLDEALPFYRKVMSGMGFSLPLDSMVDINQLEIICTKIVSGEPVSRESLSDM